MSAGSVQIHTCMMATTHGLSGGCESMHARMLRVY